jgi:hypothetical protein
VVGGPKVLAALQVGHAQFEFPVLQGIDELGRIGLAAPARLLAERLDGANRLPGCPWAGGHQEFPFALLFSEFVQAL